MTPLLDMTRQTKFSRKVSRPFLIKPFSRPTPNFILPVKSYKEFLEETRPPSLAQIKFKSCYVPSKSNTVFPGTKETGIYM